MLTPRKIVLLVFMLLAMGVGLALELPITEAEANATCAVGSEARGMCLLQQVYGRVAMIVAFWAYGAAFVGGAALYWIPSWLRRRAEVSRRDRPDLSLPPSMRRY